MKFKTPAPTLADLQRYGVKRLNPATTPVTQIEDIREKPQSHLISADIHTKHIGRRNESTNKLRG